MKDLKNSLPIPDRSAQTANSVVLLLGIVLALAYVDRQVLVILIEPIKHDLHLSDTRVGLLAGTAFTLVYATLAIPVARIADQTSRRNVIVMSLLTWSLMTSLCGLTQNFWQLIVARMGVGAGESGCIPSSHSLIASYVPPARLGTAMGAYAIGSPVGILLGMLIGGWLGELLGWRFALLLIGVPGMLMALIIRLMLREPTAASIVSTLPDGSPPISSLLGALRFAWTSKCLFFVLLGSGLTSLGVGGFLIWAPSLLARSSEMSMKAIGIWVGLIIGLGGAFGIFFGGVIADKLGRSNARWRLWTPAAASLAAACTAAVLLLQHNPVFMMIMLSFPVILGMTPTGITNAVVQSLSPVSMRAVASALLIFCNTMFGTALGPLLIGMVSDVLHASLMTESLRAALFIIPVFFLAGSACYLTAAFNLVPNSWNHGVG